MLKGNRIYMAAFVFIFVLYIIAELNAPKVFDWNPTFSSVDKNPFGSYILHEQLKQLYPSANIQTHRIPPYNVLHDKNETKSAYIMLAPDVQIGRTDLDEMLNYVRDGNVIFIAAYDATSELLDTLGVKIRDASNIISTDSTSINFTSPSIASNKFYTFKRSTIDGYFSELNKKDSTVVLGIRQDNMPDFVKRQYGKGYFLIHAAPVCFSNYFMLSDNNRDYTAKALSYLPPDISILHWDEYFKQGREGANTPLRFFLTNTFLHWALMLTVAILIIYILFEMKRRQRIIPVIEPLRNTTLDFVETVSSVYYSSHDNKSIAAKKIQFWLEHIRQRYYLSTNHLNDSFVQQLQRKSGVTKELIETILNNIKRAEAQPKVTDDVLLGLTSSIDEFYQQSKI